MTPKQLTDFVHLKQMRLWASDRSAEMLNTWDRRMDLVTNPKGEHLVGYWHINEGIYSLVYDYSTPKHTQTGSLYHVKNISQAKNFD